MNENILRVLREKALRCNGGKRGVRTWGCIALVVLMIVVMGGATCLGADLVKGEVVSVGIGGVGGKGGTYRAGAWVPVRVRLENRSGKQLVCRLGVEQVDLDGDKVLSVGAPIILDGADVSGREAWMYYWPRPDDDLRGIKTVVVLDESGAQVLATISTLTSLGGGGEANGIGPRDDTNQRSSRFVVVLGPSRAGWGSYDRSYGGTENVISAWAQQAGDLPDNVLGLDGVDTIVWEADQVHPSDIPADFQLKAMLEWVRGGGHLIVSVSTQGQDFLKSGERLRDAMPMTFTGVRELELKDLHTFPGAGETASDSSPITQILGTLRADARPVAVGNGAAGSALADHPLAVTGIYGQGAVTVLTVDADNPALAGVISEHEWMVFWNQVAGWQTGGGKSPLLTRAEFDEQKTANELKKVDPPVYMPAAELHIGEDIPQLVDVTQETIVRLMVAVVFLGVYWLLAGPIGHLVLRHYKVVHWSWWIFGATVVVAVGVAGAIVTFLQLTGYDLRHKTVVLGTLNSTEVTVIGYYGIYAPASGGLMVSQPESAKEVGGLNYLAPMCMPTVENVKPFADPQSYRLFDERPEDAVPVFRNTLKKMQGRWRGTRDGLAGSVKFEGGSEHPLAGVITNRSGYDLEHVEFVVHFPPGVMARGEGSSYLYEAPDWKNGGVLDLTKSLAIEHPKGIDQPFVFEQVLETLGQHLSESSAIASIGHPAQQQTQEEIDAISGRSVDLLYLFLDARQPDGLDRPERVEPIRTFTRTMDCTKAFYAAGAMVVARAGDIGHQRFVASPVPLTVNGRNVAGKGDVLFAWALPIAGTITASPALPDLNKPVSPPPITITGKKLNSAQESP